LKRDTKSKNKGFYRYVSQKRKVKASVPALRNMYGTLVSTDEEKADVLNNIFASVFTGNLSPLPSPADGPQDADQRGKAPPTVKKDQVWDYLRNLNIYKSMRPDEKHPRVMRELADLTTKTLPIIFERL